MTTEVVKSVSISNLINQRAGILKKIRQALDLLVDAADLAAAAHIRFPDLTLEDSSRRYGRSLSSSDKRARAELEELIRQHIDASAWQYLMAESGLQTFMDAKAREKWRSALVGDAIPELTPANVEATFSSLYAARGEMFEQGVISCFKALSWVYKSNLPQKFGKRIVMTNLTGFYNSSRCDQLDDLLRVFHVLDGKPEPDHREGMYAQLATVGAFHRSRTGVFENAYIKLRWFKNRNAHIEFRRRDLVEQMNQIIARHYPNALPEPR